MEASVMEEVRGTPITNQADVHRLSTLERRRLVMDVCSAVQHAHMKGVVHRDLKPSNVLVAVTEAGPRVKIIGFAMANANGIGLRMPRFRLIRRGDPRAESHTMNLRAVVAVGLAGLAGLGVLLGAAWGPLGLRGVSMHELGRSFGSSLFLAGEFETVHEVRISVERARPMDRISQTSAAIDGIALDLTWHMLDREIIGLRYRIR